MNLESNHHEWCDCARSQPYIIMHQKELSLWMLGKDTLAHRSREFIIVVMIPRAVTIFLQMTELFYNFNYIHIFTYIMKITKLTNVTKGQFTGRANSSLTSCLVIINFLS